MAEVELSICNPIGYWESGWNANYSLVHALASGNYVPGGISATHTRSSTPSYLLKRGMFSVDLSGLPPSIFIGGAKIILPNTWGISNERDIKAVLVDGTDVPTNDSGYGVIRDRIVDFGHLDMPNPTDFGNGATEIILNAAGRAHLEAHAGGIATFGWRIDQDILEIQPTATSQQYCGFAVTGEDVAYIDVPYYEELSPRATVEVEDVIALEAIHRMEMAAEGRFHIDAEGNAVYKSRFARSG